MKKIIVNAAFAFTALLGGLAITACSDESIDDLLVLYSNAFRSGDMEGAKKYVEKACQKGSGFGCYSMGELLIREEKHQQSVPFFEQGCNLNRGEACAELGVIYLKGLGTGQDKAKAVELLKKACNMDQETGCYIMGGLHKLGDGVPLDEKKAVEYFYRSCKLGLPEGCIIYQQSNQ